MSREMRSANKKPWKWAMKPGRESSLVLKVIYRGRAFSGTRRISSADV